MKRARQSPPTEIPMALESTLANLASFMPRTPENLPMVSLSIFFCINFGNMKIFNDES